jgi:hypothetical protein
VHGRPEGGVFSGRKTDLDVACGETFDQREEIALLEAHVRGEQVRELLHHLNRLRPAPSQLGRKSVQPLVLEQRPDYERLGVLENDDEREQKLLLLTEVGNSVLFEEVQEGRSGHRCIRAAGAAAEAPGRNQRPMVIVRERHEGAMPSHRLLGGAVRHDQDWAAGDAHEAVRDTAEERRSKGAAPT